MVTRKLRYRWRIISLMTVLLILTMSTLSGAWAQTAGSCSATYSIVNQWPGAFQGKVVVANSGTSAITGWTVTWTFANGQTIYQLWGGVFTRTWPM